MKESVCKLEKVVGRRECYKLFSRHNVIKKNKQVKITVFWNKIIISTPNIDSLNIRSVFKSKDCERYSFTFEAKEDLNNGFYDIIEIDDDSIEIVFL